LLLNHVPVVGALFALVLFGSALILREKVSPKFALGFTAALALVAVAVYFTGEPAEDAVEKLAGVTERSIKVHEEAAELGTIAFAVLGGLSILALIAFRTKNIPRWVTVAGLVGVTGVSGLMAWTANLGGQIRHTEIGGAGVSSSPTMLTR
jgi:prepilin signal peptidase PulO-like enzyme (type II secretory pathway)